MLTIRMQRTGRSGSAMFRVVVQDARQTPTSGKVVALLGNYNPHTKSLAVDKEKASFYLEHGAQPSPRAARLLKTDGVKLPSWVVLADAKQGKRRNPEKFRRDRPAEAAPAEAPATEVTEPVAEAEVAETPAELEASTDEVSADAE